ncbi:TRAP transporter small permease [Bythopirellula polymerisocia]|uniref:2,3-diketo-L-gulonate TRAP transporter small permease protein YiaM n=1 Tax=Bythopirellula polymerisocia TaxID=2528003 RepID=A0A5C6CVQ0_9BACT|nr:TRAP transporter small permease [Bythopirellula polymerisocia]TWU27577.1 2,3-diketo-L-gulonate TRAP transporter small permease protein YiaM [Bythopirellula polymerisocia]
MSDLRQHLRSALNFLLEWVVVLCFTALVLDVLWGIVSRYLLGSQSPWTDELATTLMIWVALLGAALAYSENRHLGLDVLFAQLHPDTQRVNAILADILVAIFAATVMVSGGWFNAYETLLTKQFLPALGWLKGYVYLAMPLSGLIILYYSLDDCWSRLVEPAPPLSSEGETCSLSTPQKGEA